MIYFIQAGEAGPVKIGYSASRSGVRQRLNALQGGSSERLIVRAVMDGGRDIEVELHSKYDSGYLRGEWFAPSPDLVAEMADHAVDPHEFWPQTGGGTTDRQQGPSERFEMRVSRSLLESIDAARGNETRAAWIKRTLAAALGAVDERIEPASRGGRKRADLTSSASRRAPVPTSADGQRLWPCPRAQCRQMGVAGERCPIDTHLTFKEG